MPATAARLESPATDDIVRMYVTRNPKAPMNAARTAGRAAAALSKAMLQLSAEEQRKLSGYSGAALRRLLGSLVAAPAPAGRGHTEAEDLVGEGLEAPISVTEGRRRLTAGTDPVALEDWAGPVAGSTQLEREHGISRSTLHEWQRQGAVLGLLKGRKAHVFPVAQFIDGRPVEGVPGIVKAVGSARAAWFWLVTPHPELAARPPLDLLKEGKVDQVVGLAERDYGQP